MDDLQVTRVPISELRAHPRNSRRHGEDQINTLARSIKKFGFLFPVLINQQKTILAGHARVEAARKLGVTAIPCVVADHLSEAQQRAYMIADNRIAQLAVWDVPTLGEELQFLSSEEVEFELDDVTITGFTAAEVDVIIDGGDTIEIGLERALGKKSRRQQDDPADQLPELATHEPPVSQAGDLWIIGEHRLLCGNALEAPAYKGLMARRGKPERAAIAFADPPYNVPIDGHATGLGILRHREFAHASGEMTADEFCQFLRAALRLVAASSKRGAVLYICMDWRHQFELLSAARDVGLEPLNMCVWVKPVGGMGSLYRSRHELVFVYRNGSGPHRNNVQLGANGRNRTNVWEYPGVVGTGMHGRNRLHMHPTTKPTALVADALRDTSRRGDIVLDPFGGSGTTLMACERTGRRGRLIEIDPHYCDVTIRRWEAVTGGQAVHATSGDTFADRQGRLEDHSNSTKQSRTRTNRSEDC